MDSCSDVPQRKRIAAACRVLQEQFPGEDIYPQKLRYWISKMNVSEHAKDQERAKESQQRRTLQVENNRLRRELRSVNDDKSFFSDFKERLLSVVGEMPRMPLMPHRDPVLPNPGAKHMTAELLFSDLQVGKLMSGYNSDIAEARVREYGEVACAEIWRRIGEGWDFDKIVFAVLGDLIESDRKHLNSGRGCDSSTPEQMACATRIVYQHIIQPLSNFGIPMEIVCVTGNHDHDGHGMEMAFPGRHHLSFPIFHSWKLLIEAQDTDHVTLHIPDGPFHVVDYYGQKALYEHGHKCGISEKSLQDRRGQRSVQVREHLTYFRMGDKHNASRFACDSLVVNGAFFGDCDQGSDYNSIMGYDNRPWQLMFFHVPRSDEFRTTLYDSFAIQLGHIREGV